MLPCVCVCVCHVAQAHMSRAPLPISDYITDTKGVLDNSLRILQVRCHPGHSLWPNLSFLIRCALVTSPTAHQDRQEQVHKRAQCMHSVLLPHCCWGALRCFA